MTDAYMIPQALCRPNAPSYLEEGEKVGTAFCPNCRNEPNWLNLKFPLHEDLPLGYHHWLCWDCFHTWYDAQGPGEELKEENIELFKKWELEFARKVVSSFDREAKKFRILLGATEVKE